MTPAKPSSAPIGICTATGLACSLEPICSTVPPKSAPTRSILLTKQMRGTPYLSAWRQTVSDCGSTPATASNTATAPSRTAQRALHLGREIDVAGRIDDVDAVIAPEAGGRRRGDGDAALLLLRHPVHDRRAVMDLAQLVGDPGVVQDALGRGRLPGIDVRHDADVPIAAERDLPGHDCGLLRSGGTARGAPRLQLGDRHGSFSPAVSRRRYHR